MDHRASLTRWLAALVLAAVVGLMVRPAQAHDFRPGVLSIEEREPGEYAFSFELPVDSRGETASIVPSFPSHCEVREASSSGAQVDCGSRGLHGPIGFEGDYDPRVRVVVHVRHRSGAVEQAMFIGSEGSVEIGGERSWVGWIQVGIEHIVFGPDHLAFVFGLVLLVGLHASKLLTTLTAFTIAHSLTLALAVLGALTLPPAPVETLIAVSVLLLAHETAVPADEVAAERRTWSQRWPWLVAGLFGLVHGLGFAGALGELSLPPDAIGRSLLWFNVGVELGQLAFVLVLAAVWLALRPALAGRRWPRLLVRYVLGSLAAWWTIDRLVAMLG